VRAARYEERGSPQEEAWAVRGEDPLAHQGLPARQGRRALRALAVPEVRPDRRPDPPVVRDVAAVLVAAPVAAGTQVAAHSDVEEW
jgi:hypothetical protein